jgi:hypothetical protein
MVLFKMTQEHLALENRPVYRDRGSDATMEVRMADNGAVAAPPGPRAAC